MAACDGIPELCIEVTTDSENEEIVLIRETDAVLGSGPNVVVKTPRVNWKAFLDGVKAGNFDNV